MELTKKSITTHNTPGRGDLSVMNADEIPFAVKRIFWITRMPQLARRGGHAHREGHQFLIVPHGAVQIIAVGPGMKQTRFTLAKPEEALYVPPMHWLSIQNLHPKTALLVLASNAYDERDYIRSAEEFEKLARA